MSNTDLILSAHVYKAVLTSLTEYSGNYFEIGVFNGSGTAILGREYINKIIYAIDPFIEDGHTLDVSNVACGDKMLTQKESCLANIKGLDNILLFETTSKEFSDILTSEMIDDMNISWVTIDGSHHYEDVTIDYELAINLINGKPGIIVFDDLAHKGVRQAYDEFVGKYKDIIEPSILVGENIARIVRINI